MGVGRIFLPSPDHIPITVMLPLKGKRKARVLKTASLNCVVGVLIVCGNYSEARFGGPRSRLFSKDDPLALVEGASYGTTISKHAHGKTGPEHRPARGLSHYTQRQSVWEFLTMVDFPRGRDGVNERRRDCTPRKFGVRGTD